jgi:hypothetical protein
MKQKNKLKSSTMRWVRDAMHMWEKTNSHRVLVGKPKGKQPFSRPRHRMEE